VDFEQINDRTYRSGAQVGISTKDFFLNVTHIWVEAEAVTKRKITERDCTKNK
jgi:hypothetical protein